MADRWMNLVRGFGSILDIWPPPRKRKEISPHDATEIVRQSWQDVGDALWAAMGAIDLDAKGEEAETATEEEEHRQDGASDRG